jgi:hypothetical protein
MIEQCNHKSSDTWKLCPECQNGIDPTISDIFHLKQAFYMGIIDGYFVAVYASKCKNPNKCGFEYKFQHEEKVK